MCISFYKWRRERASERERELTVRTSFIVIGAFAAAMIDLRSRRENQIQGRDETRPLTARRERGAMRQKILKSMSDLRRQVNEKGVEGERGERYNTFYFSLLVVRNVTNSEPI